MRYVKNKDTAYFFVDESGDPTFYDKYGNCIVGRDGCSRIFILGFITTIDPVSIRKALIKARTELANDQYLQGIPSLEKSIRAFHAKDDCPEVRQLIFKTIVNLDFSAQYGSHANGFQLLLESPEGKASPAYAGGFAFTIITVIFVVVLGGKLN